MNINYDRKKELEFESENYHNEMKMSIELF